MANDAGLIAVLEAWMISVLAALTSSNELVFRTTDHWKHQISGLSGGLEKFTSLAPFAFVSYQSSDSAREGDYDLRQVIELVILIGVESKEDGVARLGDANNLGTSKIRDLVISAFDKNRPSSSFAFAIDEFYYTGDVEVIDTPKRHAIQMTFECSYLTT